MMAQLRQNIRGGSTRNSAGRATETTDPKSELHSAAAEGDIDKVRELLGSGEVKVDDADEWGYYALLRAAERGQAQCVEFLLQQGSHLQHSKWCENTPMILAAENGHCDVVHQLLQAGADPRATDAFGNTTLHKAVSYNHLGIVWELVSHGIEVNALNKYRMSAVHIAARNGYRDVLELLLSDPKCEVDLRDIDNTTPLEYACRWGWENCVSLLLSKDAWVNTDIENPRCPLNEALKNKKIGVCSLIIAHMLKVDCVHDKSQPWDALTNVTQTVLCSPRAEDVHPYLHAILRSNMCNVRRRRTRVRGTTLVRSPEVSPNPPGMKLCMLLVRGVHVETLGAKYGQDFFLEIAYDWRSTELLRCLYEAGHCFDQTWLTASVNILGDTESKVELTFKKVAQTIRDQTGQPRTLKSLSRIAVRKQISHVMMKMDSLPLPKRLKMYLIEL